MKRPLRILMLSRSYPSDVFPNLGLWVERPTVLLNERKGYEVRVVSPQPYCPPLPPLGPLHQYARFRRIATREVRNGVEIIRPRFAAGPGHTASAFESRAYARAIGRALARLGSRVSIRPHPRPLHLSGGCGGSRPQPQIRRSVRHYGARAMDAGAVREVCGAPPQPRSGPRGTRDHGRLRVSPTLDPRLGPRMSARTSIVPVGVDDRMFRPIGDGGYVEDQILYVGWLNYNKGVDVLLRAIALLRDRGEPGRLLLVGGSYFRGTRRDERELRSLADELELGERVTFAGPKPQQEVARLMAGSALLVLASRAEAFGTVLAEALACGTPVVSTRSGGPEDYVTPEVGRLVPVGDSEALADALATVLRQRASFAPERLRRFALERFSWSSVIDCWLEAYSRAIGSPREAATYPRHSGVRS